MNDQPVTNVNVNQPPTPEPSFPITLSAVYYELRTLSSKFDMFAALPHDVNDHEARIRDVEKNQGAFVTKSQATWAMGTLLALVVAVTGVLALILK